MTSARGPEAPRPSERGETPRPGSPRTNMGIRPDVMGHGIPLISGAGCKKVSQGHQVIGNQGVPTYAPNEFPQLPTQ